jgi:hypothetical protein
MGPGEANYFISYNGLGAIAKLATSYPCVCAGHHRTSGYLEPEDGGGASGGSAVSGTSSRNTRCPPFVSPLAIRCAAALSVKGPTRTR